MAANGAAHAGELRRIERQPLLLRHLHGDRGELGHPGGAAERPAALAQAAQRFRAIPVAHLARRQLHAGDAGDFWCIGEDISVPDMERRRGPKEKWGVDGDRARRILNLTDGSEKPPGEWNEMVIECRGRAITVWVNGDLVNHGTDCTADRGQIALQAEGAACEFRRLELTPL